MGTEELGQDYAGLGRPNAALRNLAKAAFIDLWRVTDIPVSQTL